MRPSKEEFLAKVRAMKNPQRPTSITLNRLGSIHKITQLRSRIPLSAVAVLPVPIINDGAWGLASLLSSQVPKEQSFTAPWGAIVWPTLQSDQIEIHNFLEEEELKSHRNKVGAVQMSHADLQRLCSRLDKVFSKPVAFFPTLKPLAQAYAGLLTQEMLPLVYHMAPSTSDWLT